MHPQLKIHKQYKIKTLKIYQNKYDQNKNKINNPHTHTETKKNQTTNNNKLDIKQTHAPKIKISKFKQNRITAP